MEKTLVLVKPDGVQRALSGEIVSRFEKRGLRVVALKMCRMSRETAEKHYGEHLGKPFYPALVDYIISGPIVAMVLQGDNAIKAVRTMMGATNPVDAVPGSIRGDLALTMSNNVIHGSDGPESSVREISIFFSPEEILND